MTGAYLRVQRDGKWQALEVEHLTLAELTAVFEGRDVKELIRWIDILCATLRKVEAVVESKDLQV